MCKLTLGGKMNYFILKNHINNTEIFSGYYSSFIKCLEDAVGKNTDLTYVNLKNLNLSNANLDNAYMPGALLSGTNLTGANLSESNLRETIFYNCSLYNTCLSYSNLQGSDFRSANFGATLIDGSNMMECIFSTLSCFDLDFYFTQNMKGCLFASADGSMHKMSTPPIILKGLMSKNIIILDNAVKIDVNIFPKTILPSLVKKLGSYINSPLANNNWPRCDFKETEKLA